MSLAIKVSVTVYDITTSPKTLVMENEPADSVRALPSYTIVYRNGHCTIYGRDEFTVEAS